MIPDNAYLGKSCRYGHTYGGTGKSIRYRSNGKCMMCRKSYDHTYSNRIDKGDRPGYIYLFGSMNQFYKIGRTIDPTKRIKNIRSHNAFPPSLVELFWVNDYVDMENSLHRMYRDHRQDYEWFQLIQEQVWEIEDYILSSGGERVTEDSAIMDIESIYHCSNTVLHL